MRAHGGSSSALRRLFAAGSGKLAHFALRAVRSGRFSAKYASDNSSAGGAMLALSSSPARMIRAAFPCASGNTNALVQILTYLISAGRLCIPAAGFTYDIRGTCHTCCGCRRRIGGAAPLRRQRVSAHALYAGRENTPGRSVFGAGIGS